jgi:hypothetical protein
MPIVGDFEFNTRLSNGFGRKIEPMAAVAINYLPIESESKTAA